MSFRRLVRLSFMVGLFTAEARGQITFFPDQVRSISVTGYGSIVTRPDLAVVSLGAFALDTNLGKAKESVDSVINRLVALASQLKMPREDLVTSSVYVSPEYIDNDPQKFRGYEVTRSLSLTVRDLSLLPRLLDGAVEAGANRDFNVTLKASREVDLKQQALAAAIDDARAHAEFAAKKFHVDIGAVRSINLNKAAYSTQASGANYNAGITATFLPGDVRTDAEVSVSFFLVDSPEKK
jgi:uncharacterized protein YggE